MLRAAFSVLRVLLPWRGFAADAIERLCVVLRLMVHALQQSSILPS